MTLAIRTPAADDHEDSPRRVGDAVAGLAPRHAAAMNACAFATDLRERRISRTRYIAFVTAMYPCVIGFNRALIRSISKVDHVRHSSFVRMLAEQLEEEQAHNQMWRTMLDLYGIDHDAVYGALEDYLARFSTPELTDMTRGVLEALRVNPSNVAPGIFPDPLFPEPVLAVYHQLWMSASDDTVNYWAHFASQSAVEMVIYDVVSASVLPGLVGNPALEAGPASTQWWREHGRAESSVNEARIDEEKHLELSRIALNRSEMANTVRDAVLARADDTLVLFAATLTCQDRATEGFPVDRFAKRPRRTGS